MMAKTKNDIYYKFIGNQCRRTASSSPGTIVMFAHFVVLLHDPDADAIVGARIHVAELLHDAQS